MDLDDRLSSQHRFIDKNTIHAPRGHRDDSRHRNAGCMSAGCLYGFSQLSEQFSR